MTSLSSQERTVIQTLLELNYSIRAIARFIKRSPSTVSIEIHQVTPYKAERLVRNEYLPAEYRRQLVCLRSHGR